MRRIFRLLRNQRINILKTIIFNLRAFPLNIALKFPIYIYNNTKIISIGKISINPDKLEKGMIRIGKKNFFASFTTQFINSGEIHFEGKCLIESGTCINNSGVMNLGRETRIGEKCNIIIVNKLTIGDFTRIAFETVIMDTDFHYIVNTEKGIIKKNYGEIKLGSYNWIGNRSMIKKNTITKDFTIVSSLSMLNKSYVSENDFPLIAGCPAKIISHGWRRVYNDYNNKELNIFFKDNKHDNYILDIQNNFNWDKYCLGGDEILKF